MKYIKTFESKNSLKWTRATEAVDIIKRVLDLCGIIYQTWDSSYNEWWSIDGEDNYYRNLYNFSYIKSDNDYKNNDLDFVRIIISNHATNRQDYRYTGTPCEVYVMSDNPNTDEIQVNNATELLDALSYYGIDIKNIMKDIND